MSGQSPLNKAAAAAALLTCGIYAAPGFCHDLIDELHTTDTTHGLYEVREEARKFVAEQNSKDHTQWVALEPNLKAQVTRCAVPLKVKWAPASYGLSGKNVLVYCTQVIPGHSESKQWTLVVPVAASVPK